MKRISLSRRDRVLIGGIALIGLLAAYWFLVIAPKRSEAGKLQSKVNKSAQTLDQAKGVLVGFQGDKATYQANYTAIVRLGKAVPETTDMPSLLIQLDRAARRSRIDFRRVATQQSSSPPPAPAASAPPSTGSGSTGGSGGSGSDSSSQQASGSSTAGAQGTGAVQAANGAAQQGSQPSGSAPPAQAGSGPAPAPGGASNDVFTAVPIQFTFEGSFFNLDDFMRRLRALVAPSKSRVAVSGRLLILNGLDFSAGSKGFPQVKATIAATAYITPAGQGLTAGATPAGPAGAGGGTTQTSAPSSGPATATATGVGP